MKHQDTMSQKLNQSPGKPLLASHQNETQFPWEQSEPV